MAEFIGAIGLLGLLVGLGIVAVAFVALMRPSPYQPVGIGGCLMGFGILVVGGLILMASTGQRLDQQLAVSGASQVSSQLAGEVSSAQRLSNDEAGRAKTLADAERQNKEGQASLNEATGKFNLANAQATKTIVESKVLDDDRQAKKFGYGGLAAADLINGVGGIGNILGGSACLVFFLVGLGFLGGLRLVTGRYSK